MDNPLTLQEAKDQAARNWNEAFDFNALYGGVSVGNIKMIHLKGVIDDAMELYARSKWDEACDAQRDLCIDSWELGFIPTQAPKPEFKP